MAYTLWAEISDLHDDPRGPQSEELCNKNAMRASIDWLQLDRDSTEAVDGYFERWDPHVGSAWTLED